MLVVMVERVGTQSTESAMTTCQQIKPSKHDKITLIGDLQSGSEALAFLITTAEFAKTFK